MGLNSNIAHQYSTDQLEKIGNTIIYLTEHKNHCIKQNF